MAEFVSLLDTTLRDGVQAPGISFTAKERLELAASLQVAGVDVIEVAFPGVSTDEHESTRAIAKYVSNASICCLARTITKDIDIAAELLRGAPNARIHLYLGRNQVRAAEHEGPEKEEILSLVESMVRRARNRVAQVQFSPQDATQVAFESLAALSSAALTGGADTINISDTVGLSNPAEINTLFHGLFSAVPELEGAVVSFHGHDNLGLATDNAMAAISAGVRQIEGTIEGIGPGGGNTDLLDVVRRVRAESAELGVRVRADHVALREIANGMPTHSVSKRLADS